MSYGALLPPGANAQWRQLKGGFSIASYPAGSSPAVRYNPQSPEECVLETSKPGALYWVMALFGFLSIGFGAFWLSSMG